MWMGECGREREGGGRCSGRGGVEDAVMLGSDRVERWRNAGEMRQLGMRADGEVGGWAEREGGWSTWGLGQGGREGETWVEVEEKGSELLA